MPRELPILTMRVLVVMCLQCRHAGLDPQAAVQPANAAYQPRRALRAVGGMRLFDARMS